MKTALRHFLFGTSLNDHKMLNLGILLFRLHIGLSIAIHAGWPKMNTLAAPGWFNDQVAGLGFTFPSPAFWATLASWGEFIGGLAIAFGLLTRFNALQLAIQFFVIAFLWYDHPEPISGMYFQNTLFMGFVLLLFTGAGRYSVDQLIMAGKKPRLQTTVKTGIAIGLMMVSLNVSAQGKPLNGSGKIVERTFNYENFDQLQIRDLSGKITVETGKPFSVSVSIDDNLEPLLRVSNQNGELQMELEDNENNRRYIEATHIRIVITMPVLNSLRYRSNSDISISGIQQALLKIRAAGNGDIMLSGKTEELDIEKSGNGDLKAEGLLATRVQVQKSGNGDVLINTPNPFRANGSGNGDVINRNEGSPERGSGIDGNGEIRYKNQPAAPAMGDLKRVDVRINNETAEWIELIVRFPGRGSYGIDLKAYSTVKETVPVGTRFYREGNNTQPVYEVTAEEKQKFSISK